MGRKGENNEKKGLETVTILRRENHNTSSKGASSYILTFTPQREKI